MPMRLDVIVVSGTHKVVISGKRLVSILQHTQVIRSMRMME